MRLPVSVKGVVLDGEGRVVLLENERGEWELPGGRLEAGESLRECVEREIYEELGIRAGIGTLLDAYVYEVVEGKRVLIVAYGCFVEEFSGLRVSGEHMGAEFFEVSKLGGVKLSEGYRRVVRMWAEHLGREA